MPKTASFLQDEDNLIQVGNKLKQLALSLPPEFSLENSSFLTECGGYLCYLLNQSKCAMRQKAPKPEIFETYMKGDHALLHLDARREGVKVPTKLSTEYALALKLSYLFQGEINFDQRGITAFLKFDGDYEECIIPWSAIWGIASSTGESSVWPEDMPKELILEFAKRKLSELGQKVFGKKKDKEMPVTSDAQEERKEEKKGGHLKRVK